MTSEAEPDTIASEKEEVDVAWSEKEEAVLSEKEEEEQDVGEVEFEPETTDYGEDYTPLCSNEDSEKQHYYKEYRRLEKDINCQNKVLERIKGQIQDIECKPCPTRCEQNDLKVLYDCLEQETNKLKCLSDKAMQLQNFGSKRHYKEFALATTFDEDNMHSIAGIFKKLQLRTCKDSAKQEFASCWRASGGESSELDKSCSCLKTIEHAHTGGGLISESEERKLIKEIFAALKNECTKSKKKSQQKKQQHACPCKENDSMEKMKNKVDCMQQAMSKIKEELCKGEKNFSCPCHHHQHQSSQKSCFSPTSTVDPAILCPGKKSTTVAEKFKKLQENYLFLLTEFSKKDEQLKELTKKLRNSCGKCSIGNEGVITESGNIDESEIHLLRTRINDMTEEQVEFKCLMREQSMQLDEYRNKYISAQQKVEEQCVLLEKLNMNNKRIEKQINLEIKEIRSKFQEKLNDLLKFPRLLENEQIKLAHTTKEKEALEAKLVVVCKELKNLKSKMQNNNQEDCKPQLQRCQQELCQAKKKLEEIQRQRDMFCQQLNTTKEDLDTLRSESAKIIARTKERAELFKQQQQEHIDKLEKQLAQCRATACLSVSDRETVIREMQGQLNTLSYSFDTAQKQIKTLRNHIAYMTNENCFPAKC